MAVESACIPMPSEIIMPLAGWMLIADRGLGLEYVALIGLLGAAGNAIGSVAAYWVGAGAGLPFINRYGKYLLISHKDIESADYWFDKYGDRIVFFSRLLPVVRTFISFPAGMAKMRMGKFVFYSFLGSIPWSMALTYSGYAMGRNWERIRDVMRPFDIPILAVFLALVALFIWHRLKSPSSQS